MAQKDNTHKLWSSWCGSERQHTQIVVVHINVGVADKDNTHKLWLSILMLMWLRKTTHKLWSCWYGSERQHTQTAVMLLWLGKTHTNCGHVGVAQKDNTHTNGGHVGVAWKDNTHKLQSCWCG